MRLKKQLLGVSLTLLMMTTTQAQDSTNAPPATLHPALFLVGDSIMRTGNGTGENGQWGWGSEITPLFDPAKIHVYNEGRGGRSSRSYIEEGLWAKILDRLQSGDFILLQFGHNDSSNSQSHPDRATITGGGDESVHFGVGASNKVVRTYGWYLRQYVKDAKAKGAVIIICSPVPRNTWSEGKIKRGFDGYAQWAADAAKASGALFIDLNTIAANRYDALGQEKTAELFSDTQHTKKAGARLNAESVIEGLKKLKGCPLANDLAPSVP
jgi:rhamnogalacturonan acetylesterase